MKKNEQSALKQHFEMQFKLQVAVVNTATKCLIQRADPIKPLLLHFLYLQWNY